MQSVSIIVPIFNERENIVELHRQLTQAMANHDGKVEFLFVDDGSTDGSRNVLRQLADQDDTLRVLCLRKNFGQTAAMQAGIDAAGGEVVVLLDGDLQNDPADIPRMLLKLDEGYDLVCGWRKDRHDVLWSRKIPSWIANWLIARVTHVPIHDLGCSLKAIHRNLACELELVGEMHRFIPILAQQRGARCTEIVTHHRPRVAGTSKYGLSRVTRVILDLVTVKFLLDYLSSPIKLFGKLALGCGLLSLIAAGATMWMKVARGMDMTGNPLLLLSVFAAMAGLQFISMGLLGELCIRLYFDRASRRPYAIAEIIERDRKGVRLSA